MTELGKRLIEEGKREGAKEGEKKKAIEIARNLLDVLPIETIVKKTGLTMDEVEKLKLQVHSQNK